jgi:hypothetical protein
MSGMDWITLGSPVWMTYRTDLSSSHWIKLISTQGILRPPDYSFLSCCCDFSMWYIFEVICSPFIRGLHRDVVCLCWPTAPSYTSLNAGGLGGCGVQPLSTAVLITWHGAQKNFWGDLPPYLTYATCPQFKFFCKWSRKQNYEHKMKKNKN